MSTKNLTNFDVGDQRAGLEHHAVVVGAGNAGRRGIDLLAHEGHVGTQAQVVLLVGDRTGLAGHAHAQAGVAVAQAAQALDHQHVVVGPGVDEHDAAVDLEVVSSLADVAAGHVGVVLVTSSQTQQGQDGKSQHLVTKLHLHIP